MTARRSHRLDAVGQLAFAGQPVVTIDPWTRKIRKTNPAFQEAFGWSASELDGRVWTRLIPGEEATKVRDLLARLAFGGGLETVSIEVLDRAGERVETRWTGIPNLAPSRMEPLTVLIRPVGSHELVRIPPVPRALRADGSLKRIPPSNPDETRGGKTSRNLW